MIELIASALWGYALWLALRSIFIDNGDNKQ